MEVKLEKRYPLEVDAERAWAVLRNVPATAECMPGATITEQVDATHYKGHVKVRIGPANAAISGTIEVLALDESARRVELLGKGADRTGSQASMKLTATVEPGEAAVSSVLVGHAEVNVTGKLAQFGGRMMVQVADLLLAQFADNFRSVASSLPEGGVAALAAEGVPGDGAVVAAAIDSGADAGAAIGAGQAAQPEMQVGTQASTDDRVLFDEVLGPIPEATSAVEPDRRTDAAALGPRASQSAVDLQAAASPPQPGQASSPAPAPVQRTLPQQRRNEINGLSLTWALIKGWFRRLFDRG